MISPLTPKSSSTLSSDSAFSSISSVEGAKRSLERGAVRSVELRQRITAAAERRTGAAFCGLRLARARRGLVVSSSSYSSSSSSSSARRSRGGARSCRARRGRACARRGGPRCARAMRRVMKSHEPRFQAEECMHQPAERNRRALFVLLEFLGLAVDGRPPASGAIRSRSRARPRRRTSAANAGDAGKADAVPARQRTENIGTALSAARRRSRRQGRSAAASRRFSAGRRRRRRRSTIAADPEHQTQPFAVERPMRDQPPAPDRDAAARSRSRQARKSGSGDRMRPRPGAPRRLRIGASVA